MAPASAGEIEVYLRRPDLAPLEEVARYSIESDMVFLGLRAPELDETPEVYSAYYREIPPHHYHPGRAEALLQGHLQLSGPDLPLCGLFFRKRFI